MSSVGDRADSDRAIESKDYLARRFDLALMSWMIWRRMAIPAIITLFRIVFNLYF